MIAAVLTLHFAGPAFAALQVHWKLDETGGTAVTDSSGNHRDGTATNGVTFEANGILGGAARFDYTANQCILLRSLGVTDFPFTVSVWMKNNAAANDCVAVMGTGVFDQYHALYRMGELRERVGATYTIARRPPIVVDGQWHHLVGIWESATSRRSS
jgi:hypothetical protein